MIQAGEVMESPLVRHESRFFGHRFRVVRSARQTDDGSPRIEYFAPPRANIKEHVHPLQEKGLVVDSGGPASHAAIVAREYGIPAVMGTGDGTHMLSDRQQVCRR